MRKEIATFIFKAFLLMLPVCIVLGFVEYRLKQIPNTYNKKRVFLEDQLDSVNVLVLGASQTLFGVNPDYFSCKGFNLSNVSQSLYYDTQLSLKYIDSMKNLKCVMVSVSYYSFWYQVSDGIESWRDYYYQHFWDVEYPQLKITDPKYYSLTMLYSPELTKKYAEKKFNVDLSKNLYRNGWKNITPWQTIIASVIQPGKKRVEFHDKMRVDSRFNETFTSLSNFVQECKNRKIKVIFITTPVLPMYYKYTNPQINQKNLLAVLALCKKFDCHYYDYFRDKRFTAADFNDNDHMNFLGAAKFSKILNDDVVAKVCAGN